jgi:hypothetical protein
MCPDGQHDYQPRYDTEPGLTVDPTSHDTEAFERIMAASQIKTYVRDVCVKCGAFTDR